MSSAPVRWIVPEIKPRSASMRYRCLYPAERLRERGRNVAVAGLNADLPEGSILVVDCWLLFPSVLDPVRSEQLLAFVLARKQAGHRLVLDSCDNQFSAASPTPPWEVALARLRLLASVADDIVCCSDELRSILRDHLETNASWHVVEDPAEDVVVYPGDSRWKSTLSPAVKMAWLKAWRHSIRIAQDRRAGCTSLVWFGSHGNAFADGGMIDIAGKRELLEAVHAERSISLSIISNSRTKFDAMFSDWQLPVHYLDWDKVSFIYALRQHDIALLPSNLNDFTRCKSSNRVVQALRHGLGVIADPVPSYQRFSTVIRLGDWHRGLRWLLENPRERAAMVRRGQVEVESSNSIDAIATAWDGVFFGARS